MPELTDPSDLEKLRLHASLLAAYGDVRNTPTEAELWAGCKDAAQMLLEAADEIARLRARGEALETDRKILAWGDPAHTYECPHWRSGKKHGPCICGAKDLQDQVDAARARAGGS